MDIFSSLPYEIIRLIGIISIPVGFLSCYFGFKLYKFLIALFGLLIGLIVGSLFGGEGAAFLGGIIGAVIMYLSYKLGLLILGLSLGAIVAVLLSLVSGSPPTLELILIFAIIGAFVVFFIEKTIIILFTAFFGASRFIEGLIMVIDPEYYSKRLFYLNNDPDIAITIFIGFLILFITGILYQYGLMGNFLSPLEPKIKKTNNLTHQPINAGVNYNANPSQQYSPVNIESLKTPPVNPVFNTPKEKLIKKKIDSNPQAFNKTQDQVKSQGISSSVDSPGLSPKNVFNPIPPSDNIEYKAFIFPLRIMILTGEDANQVYQISGRPYSGYYLATIGRPTGIPPDDIPYHVPLNDNNRYVSRKHAQFFFKDNTVFIGKIAHDNILKLNGYELDTDSIYPITHGDLIEFNYIKTKMI